MEVKDLDCPNSVTKLGQATSSEPSFFVSNMREIAKWLKRTFLALKCCDYKCMLSGTFCIAGLTDKIIETVLVKASLCFQCLPCLWTVAGKRCVEYRWPL